MMYPLTTLKAIFRAEDVEGLIALGAPDDEYDSEAAELQAALNELVQEEMTPTRVESITMDIWKHFFGPFTEEDLRKRQPVLQQVVQQILNERPIAADPLGTRPMPHKTGKSAHRLSR